MMDGINKAIEASGGARSLAKALGVTHQAVYKWRRRGWVPLGRALEIEELYSIPRQELLKPTIAVLLAA